MMKKLITLVTLGLAYLFIPSIVIGQSPSFKTFNNPVIPGDHSDCTLTQIGNDFYTTGSSFNPTPVIYHSTDLVHWEAIAQPVSAEWSIYADAPQGGCWGGQVVYFNNKYWDFFGRAFQMYFVTANKPEGPWSEPTLIKSPESVPGLGADNSIFIDNDSTWYLLVKNGQPNNWIVQLGKDGQPSGAILDLTWLNVKINATDYKYSWAEGPVMWKHNGFYYYSFARDVAGGQKVMRSKTLTADKSAWTEPVDFFNENDPGKASAIFSGPNHSSAAVLLNDSTSWVMHPVWARANNSEWAGQGRQGLVNEIHYSVSNEVVGDYPVNSSKTAPKLPSSGIPWMVPKSDFFNGNVLHPEWSFLGQTASSLWSLTERPGWFRLKPKSAVKSNTIIKTDAEHNYSLITRVDFDAKTTSDEAGIRIINGMEILMAKLFSSVNAEGRKIVGFTYDAIQYQTDNAIGNTLWLKLVRVNHILSGYFSADGENWTQVGNEIKVAALDSYTKDWNGWCGNRQGLYVQGSSADFDLYLYRDAYTPILAECPANYFGTVRTKTANLDSIGNNDWALYAGVEFGNNEYAKASDSIQIVASSIVNGSSVEVWLDSIDTGNKIATCNIENTGDLNTFKAFSAKTIQTTGRHDVYLKFVGSGSGRLFILKSFKFTSKLNPQYKYSSAVNDSTIHLQLNRPVSKPLTSNGFEAFVNGKEKDSIIQAKLSTVDSSIIELTLYKKLYINDTISISYSDGGVKSYDGLELVSFENMPADNLLAGSAPKVKFIQTNRSGDSIFIKFTKKMNNPKTFQDKFNVSVNASNTNSLNSIGLKSDDATIFVIGLHSKVYYEDDVTLSYSGSDIKSIDKGIIGSMNSVLVTNISNGYAPGIKNVYLGKTGTKMNVIAITFTKILMNVSTQKQYFSVTINDKPAIISTITGSADTIQLKILSSIIDGDTIKLSYSGGIVSSIYKGLLADFTDYIITFNQVSIKSENTNHQNGVTIYPNPLHNELNIKSENEFNAISIFSIDGKLLMEQKFNVNQHATALKTNLSKGTYILKLIGNTSSTSSKIEIN